MTPKEAWTGRKPIVDHFKIFGCIAYAHIPDEKRKKLDDKGEKYVFLGVSEVSKAYKLFNPLTKKIVTSRDVVFDEENTQDWNRQYPTQVLFDNDSKREPTSTVFMPKKSSETTPPTAEILPTVVEATDTTAQSHCQILKRPAQMYDHEVIGIVQSEDPLTHFILFSNCDPTTFESVVKDAK